MYCTQIFHAEALQVLLRYGHAAMTQDAREVEQISTGPEVVQANVCQKAWGLHLTAAMPNRLHMSFMSR
jgi:hypothetical protein